MHSIAKRLLAGMLLLNGCAGASRAQADNPQKPEVDLFDPAKHMHTSEVKPGMTGYGISVFSGTKIERFEVEVISVLHNQMGPKQNVVLIRCKGQGLEHSGAVAGMSGSPIYLKDEQGRDRMIGAFALGWTYAKDPIAGVRPIEEMLRVPTEKHNEKVATANTKSGWDARPMIRALTEPKSATPLATNPEPESRSMRPLALPLAVSGVSDSFIERMRPFYASTNLTMLQSGGAGDAPEAAKDTKLEPGAAIGVPIVSGDLDMAAIGTVTEVIGNRVFAFGHEFNAEGAVELPMGVGYIHSIIASQTISFKMGSIIRHDGAIYSDESVAIAGLIGKSPEMIPVEITVQTPQRKEAKTYRYEVVRHPRFTPFGTTNAIAAAIMGHSQLPSEFTIQYSLSMQFEGGRTVEMKNQTTSLAGAMDLIRDISLPVQFAIGNPFAQTYPTKITGKVDLSYSIDAAELRSVTSDKSIYKPGETVRLFMTTRPWHGKDEVHTYEMKIPDDAAEGPIAITVSDAQRYTMDQMRLSPNQFYADSIEDVFGLVKAMTGNRSDQVFIRMTLANESVAIGRSKLPRLPAAKRQVLTHTPRQDVVTFPESVVSKHDLKGGLLGAFDLSIIVSKHPERAAPPPGGAPPMMPVQPPQQPGPPQAHDMPVD